MADTYTTSLRFQMQAFNGNSNTWGAIADTQYQMIEAAITGDNGYAGGAGGINIAGLATYTLTVAQGTADQSRQALYPFVGALAADCTVTIPGVAKIGWVLNATTGGHNVIVKVGAGTTATFLPGAVWTMFYCDGTNVTIPLTYNGGSFVSGDGGSSIDPTGKQERWGITSLTGSPQTILFSPVFPAGCDNLIICSYSSSTDARIAGKSPASFQITYSTGSFISWRAIGH